MPADAIAGVDGQAAEAHLVPAPIALRVLRNLRKSLSWAVLDVRCQYRRSRIGPWWETINVAVMIAGISLVSSAVFGGNLTNLVGYIGIGIVIWSAITALVAEGSTAFVRNASFITSSSLGSDLYVGRTVFKTLIAFSHHVFLYAIGVALLLVPIAWTSLLALVGIVLLFVNGFWVVAALAFLGARFRDVEMIVRNFLQLAFFVTPVFWDYEQIAGSRRFIVDFNPLFYFIEIVRGPLLGRIPPLHFYAVVVLATLAGYGFAYLVYRRMRRRLAFFV